MAVDISKLKDPETKAECRKVLEALIAAFPNAEQGQPT